MVIEFVDHSVFENCNGNSDRWSINKYSLFFRFRTYLFLSPGELIRAKLRSASCRYRGYILDSFPLSFAECEEIFTEQIAIAPPPPETEEVVPIPAREKKAKVPDEGEQKPPAEGEEAEEPPPEPEYERRVIAEVPNLFYFLSASEENCRSELAYLAFLDKQEEEAAAGAGDAAAPGAKRPCTGAAPGGSGQAMLDGPEEERASTWFRDNASATSTILDEILGHFAPFQTREIDGGSVEGGSAVDAAGTEGDGGGGDPLEGLEGAALEEAKHRLKQKRERKKLLDEIEQRNKVRRAILKEHLLISSFKKALEEHALNRKNRPIHNWLPELGFPLVEEAPPEPQELSPEEKAKLAEEAERSKLEEEHRKKKEKEKEKRFEKMRADELTQLESL